MDEWEELGIAPTTDPAAVRQAYARRLKTLDVDHDPAAFMRLRQAFETALAWDEEDVSPAEPLSEEHEDEAGDIADYTKAIALDPQDPEAYVYRGTFHAREGLCDEAIADYTQAIALKPDHILAYINRGRAFNQKGLYDQAIADFTRVIALRPDDAFGHYGLGVSYEGKGLPDQAIAAYQAAVEAMPKLMLVREALIRLGATPMDEDGTPDQAGAGGRGATDGALADSREIARQSVQFRKSFEALIAARDTRAASAAFQAALAEGVVGLGEERSLAAMLAGCAAAAPSLSIEEIEALNLRLGGQREGPADPGSKALNDLWLRAGALRWQAAIVHDAPLGRKSFIGFGVLRRRVRIAYALVYRDDLNLISRDLATFAAEISKAKRYAPWLDPKFPVDALDAKYARLSKDLWRSEGGAIGLGFLLLLIVGVAIGGWKLALLLGIIFVLMLLWMFKWSNR